MNNKILKNHKLINYLTDHCKIDLVSVNCTHIICTLSKKFMPSDVDEVYKASGQMPMIQSRNGKRFVIFLRNIDKTKN